MKIALSSTGPGLEDTVEPRFGRCPFFLIVDPDTMKFESIENPNAALGGGAGIQSAQLMSDKRVSHVLTGNCGPNAFQVFNAAGINVITGVTGPVRQAVQQFKSGVFNISSSANVDSHFGMGAFQESSGANMNNDKKRVGMGGGRGRGISGGGRGMGGGGGMGMGGGSGMGRGMGMGCRTGNIPGVPSAQSEQPTGRNPAGPGIDGLKSQARALEEQLNSVRQNIDKIQNKERATSALVACVDQDECILCGICLDICPESAISIDETVHIDRKICIGCGECVVECPQDALSLRKACS